MKERRLTDATAVICLAVAMLLPLAYVTGYFALSTNSTGATPEHRCRMYQSRWLTTIFKPAAKVESVVTGDKVSTYWMPGKPLAR
jgi:hypothetical protein